MVKSVALTLCILFLSSSWALAEDLAMAATEDTTTHEILGGVVKSVSWADLVKGTKSEIIVTTPARKNINILVTATTTLWDQDAKAIMSDKIIPRRHLNIIYLITPEGINVAKSIKVLK